MLLNSAGFLLGVLLLALMYGAIRTLMLGRYWFHSWMRGNAAIIGIVLAVMMILLMWDLSSYTPVEHDSRVADVTVAKAGAQQYRVRVSNDDMSEEFMIRGDMWQFDIRMIVWSGLPSLLGMKPAYRLDRLSGRYFTLEQETGSERTVYTLDRSGTPFDIWELTAHRSWLPWIEARQGVGVYMPLVDSAEFNVRLRGNELVVIPVNDVAQKAMFDWK